MFAFTRHPSALDKMLSEGIFITRALALGLNYTF